MGCTHLVQGADCRKAHHRLGGCQEQLHDGDGRLKLPSGHVRHVDDRARRLKDDNLRLVPQTALQELIEWPLP